ncbi:MAG: solute carrier family 23 protein [Adlercreutzia equolifaciens]
MPVTRPSRPTARPHLLPYACLGVALRGLLYLVLSALFKAFGRTARHALLPAGGHQALSSSASGLSWQARPSPTCERTGLSRSCAIIIIVISNIWGRGMIASSLSCWALWAPIVAAATGSVVDFTAVVEAPVDRPAGAVGITVFALFGPSFDAGLAITAIITIMPLAFATMIEHIGDMSAISSTCNRNFIAEPGLHRTLLGDGLATIVASLFGAPANTTYGENTGVLALTRVFDPRASSASPLCSPSCCRSARSSRRSSPVCRRASSAVCRWCCTA